MTTLRRGILGVLVPPLVSPSVERPPNGARAVAGGPQHAHASTMFGDASWPAAGGGCRHPGLPPQVQWRPWSWCFVDLWEEESWIEDVACSLR